MSRGALALVLLALLSGCRADPTSASTRHYACAQDSECVTGFVCLAGICQGPGAEALDAGADSDAGGTPKASSLAVLFPAQSTTAGQCTAAMVETRTASGSAFPVDAALTVALSAQPAGGVAFYEDAACTKVTSSVTVPAGTSNATLYFQGTVAQSVFIRMDAPGLTSLVFRQIIRAAAPVSMLFVTSTQSLQVGGCSARVDLELRDTYSNPAPPSSARALTLSGTGMVFYSDASCTTALTGATFAVGAPRASFYFKGKTSSLTPLTLTATVAGVTSPARQDYTLLPMVRSGRCTLPMGKTSVACPIYPAQSDLSKSMMFFQASPTSDSSPDSASVRCVLSAQDTITCDHIAAYTADIQIFWRTVELASGILVQHKQPTCMTGAQVLSVPLGTTVDPSKSFVLVSGEQGSSSVDADDFFTAKLSDSGTRVDLQYSTNCSTSWKGSLQVVQLDGAQVTRGTATMTGTSTQTYTANLSTANMNSTALLFTYRISNAATQSICDRVLRGTIISTTSVNFYRSANNTANCTSAAIDEIAWERIDFGTLAQVQSRSVGFAAGESVIHFAIPFNPLDPTLLTMFASAQGASGQAIGESAYATDDLVSEALTTFEVYASDPTQLQATRGSSKAESKVDLFMVQFMP